MIYLDLYYNSYHNFIRNYHRHYHHNNYHHHDIASQAFNRIEDYIWGLLLINLMDPYVLYYLFYTL